MLQEQCETEADMAVTADKPAPYAPAKTILDIVARHRDRGLPSPISPEVLGRAGIPESLLPRTIQALQTLDLITEAGLPTATFEGIRLAPEAEYKKRLEDWIKGAYADIFAFVDPAVDGETRIQDAFRSYQPAGQRMRMVTLFQGLCAAAGVLAEKEKSARAPAPSFSPGMRAAAARVAKERFKGTPQRSPKGQATDLPAPLAGLLASLPPEGEGWTKEARERFLTTFTAVLDFCFPITEDQDEGEDEIETATEPKLRRRI
jgi:hypothetical protein